MTTRGSLFILIKYKTIIAFFTFFDDFVTLFIVGQGSVEYSTKDSEHPYIQHVKLHQKAQSEGKVRVIVKLWINCSNPTCFKGRLYIGSIIRGMVSSKETRLQGPTPGIAAMRALQKDNLIIEELRNASKNWFKKNINPPYPP